MVDSILTTTKKVLGIAEDYEAFDPDILMHINSVFSTLNDLGVGPDAGFAIEDKSTEWSEFLGADPRLNRVKSYMYLRVKKLFDPPTTSYLLDAIDKQISEMEWRMSVYREGTAWVDPNPPDVSVDADICEPIGTTL